jgi:Flp pilus assembly pilin Flp
MWGHRQLHCLVIAAKLRLRRGDGQVLVEYALLLALLSLVSIGVLAALGGDISGLLDRAGSHMASVTNP